jgi:hypothetical protein
VLDLIERPIIGPRGGSKRPDWSGGVGLVQKCLKSLSCGVGIVRSCPFGMWNETWDFRNGQLDVDGMLVF